MPIPPEVSLDGQYILMGGTMQHLADSAYIVLDTLIKQYPPKTVGCGFVFGSFNPQQSEVLFQLACDDGVSYEVNRVGTFDYVRSRFQLFDTLVVGNNCIAPIYASDGRKIALICDGKAHIIYRGTK